MGRLFGKFEQLDSTYGREQEGTGLGLALSKRLVEMHGGEIWAESEGEGLGSVFNVLLPLSPAPALIIADTKGASERSGGKGVVLVVEDDPRSREILTHHLERAGFDVTQVGDGKRVIQLAKEVKPKAITLDILLPDTDGWEVLKSLKADPLTKEIPVFVISITEDRELGLSLGARDFFFKPIDAAKLIEALRAEVETPAESGLPGTGGKGTHDVHGADHRR
jgi:CheY-like chemotaxis protein